MTGLASSGAFEFKLFKLRQDSIDTPDPLGRSRFESHPEEFVDGDPLLAMKHERLGLGDQWTKCGSVDSRDCYSAFGDGNSMLKAELPRTK